MTRAPVARRHRPRPRAGRLLPRVDPPAGRVRPASGWVAGKPDGTVEAHVEGAPDDVEVLVAYLRHGPRGAEVTRVDVREAEPEGLDRFEVR